MTDLNADFDTFARCPLTGAPMHPHMTVPLDWRNPMAEIARTIWWSEGAPFGQILPRPELDEVAGFYDVASYYTHGDRPLPDARAESRAVGLAGRVLGSLAWRFEAGAEPTRDWWRSILPDDAGDALEIGCGDGDRMRTIAPLVRSIRGVEPDPRALSAARRRGPFEVHAGTAENLPDAVRDRRYDLIVFSHVLEHTLDPVLALDNARSLLADGGILSIEVPNNACEGARRMGPAWRWLDVPRHLNFFTPDSVQTCARAAGLRVQAVLFRGYVRQFMPDWIVDEARIRARLDHRPLSQADIDAQIRHSAALFLHTALAAPERKYDSVRILCTHA